MVKPTFNDLFSIACSLCRGKFLTFSASNRVLYYQETHIIYYLRDIPFLVWASPFHCVFHTRLDFTFVLKRVCFVRAVKERNLPRHGEQAILNECRTVQLFRVTRFVYGNRGYKIAVNVNKHCLYIYDRKKLNGWILTDMKEKCGGWNNDNVEVNAE